MSQALFRHAASYILLDADNLTTFNAIVPFQAEMSCTLLRPNRARPTPLALKVKETL